MGSFKLLKSQIIDVHAELQAETVKAINQNLTLRNWIIGFYIVEFQQNGKDRAAYGAKLLSTLAKDFKTTKGLDERAFRNFRLLYLNYPQISVFLNSSEAARITEGLKLFPIRGSLTPKLNIYQNRVDGTLVLRKLSYTHLEQLIKIEDDLKRTFYEIECIKSTWSVRELKRQIASLYYERSGMSAKPESLSALVQSQFKPNKVIDVIKNIYAFEFLDLIHRDLVEESDLEIALLDNLQAFILELGTGFCFEARQKRLLIGDNYYFVDLVFYHRILKCHIIVELKIGAFNHDGIGQLNTYLNYYQSEVKEENDNPPIGILMVTDKDKALVQYATAGMDENLFVQEYLVNLPDKKVLENHILKEIKQLKL